MNIMLSLVNMTYPAIIIKIKVVKSIFLFLQGEGPSMKRPIVTENNPCFAEDF